MNLIEKLQHGGLIAAHRGHRALFPENTMAAFEDCLTDSDFIELDVQFSKDCIPVVFHDHTLERTTNIGECGFFPEREDHCIESFNFDELQLLDTGSWFYSSDPYNQIAEGNVSVPAASDQFQNIPSLKQVLAFIGEKNLAVNVEIKNLHEDRAESAKRIIRMIRENNIIKNCVISAFDHSILKLIKELAPDITTAALVDDIHPENLTDYLKKLGVAGYHINDNLASKELFEKLKKLGIFVCVYTVNSRSRKKELKEMGASAVITDFLNR